MREDEVETRLAQEVQLLSEQLAEYREVVAEVTRLFGHAGSQPGDLQDAIGQIERILRGYDLDIVGFTGMTEDIRRLKSLAVERDRLARAELGAVLLAVELTGVSADAVRATAQSKVAVYLGEVDES